MIRNLLARRAAARVERDADPYTVAEREMLRDNLPEAKALRRRRRRSRSQLLKGAGS